MNCVGKRFRNSETIYEIREQYDCDGGVFIVLWNVIKNCKTNTRYPLTMLKLGLGLGIFEWCSQMEPIKHIKKHSLGNIGRENKLMTE